MFIGAIGCEPLQLRRVHLENSRSLEVYRRNGGYEAIKQVLDSMSPDDVINEVRNHLCVVARGRIPHRNEMEFLSPKTHLRTNTSSAMLMSQSQAPSKIAI